LTKRTLSSKKLVATSQLGGGQVCGNDQPMFQGGPLTPSEGEWRCVLPPAAKRTGPRQDRPEHSFEETATGPACHAPGNTGTVSAEAVTAAVPVPSEPLPLPSQGYQQSSPDLLVRVDVTYLRQDFSMLLPVTDANPWPEMQRFDFLVRARVLTDKAAKAFEEALAKRGPGVLSPYHRAALAALRELTGRDTEPTPEAWRRLLRLPAQERSLQTAQR
jgi:hypothetical protein